jgi:hypothetical protein
MMPTLIVLPLGYFVAFLVLIALQMVDLAGIEPATSSLRTMRSPS